jgi:hypothetical protein
MMLEIGTFKFIFQFFDDESSEEVQLVLKKLPKRVSISLESSKLLTLQEKRQNNKN